MIKVLIERIRQGHRTIDFPEGEPTLPDLYRGRPEKIDQSLCDNGCNLCVQICPTKAIWRENGDIKIDLGRCLFCPECEQICPKNLIKFTKDYRLAVSKRSDLVVGKKEIELAAALDEKLRKVFGRSLKLRQVSAGGCNACEADVNVLNTVVFDLGRFGIQFVASPRHADGILVTGPVTENMKLALEKTYRAVPEPKIVIAVGACAISGGPFIDHSEVNNGVDRIIPVDLYIPGCPPHPITILDGLLRLIGKIEKK